MFMLVGHHEINPCQSLLICLDIVMEHNKIALKRDKPKGFLSLFFLSPFAGCFV
jgi:hypothetical protein